MERLFLRALDGRKYTSAEQDLFNELYFSFEHHGSLSQPDAALHLDLINERLLDLNAFLRSAQVLFISFGTAFYYRHLKKDLLVANCHKMPAAEFSKSISSVDEIVTAYKDFQNRLFEVNPAIQLVYTVSPVRHIRDGIISNTKSKATLQLAINDLLACGERVFYFPAYEILLDELRDYRFYGEDMVHPSKQAIKIIWEYFSGACFDDDLLTELKAYDKIVAMINHRPLHPERKMHQKFKEALRVKINDFSKKYSGYKFKIDTSNES